MKNRAAAIVIVTVLALAGVGSAAAYPHGGPHHGGMELMVFRAVLQPKQHDQVKAIFKGERETFMSLHKQLHEARQALVDKLLSSNQADVSSEVNRLKQAQAAIMDEHIKIALKIRGLLSPAQLAKAGKIYAGLRDLREKEHALLMPEGGAGPMHEHPTEQ